MTVLVTGAAGFIGSHLCEALTARGNRVVGIDNFDPFYDREIKEANLKNLLQEALFSFIEGSAGDTNLLNRISPKIDVVVHLAAKAGIQPSLKDAQGYIDSNISVTRNLLDWMRNAGIKKFVFASSSSVYGNNKKIPFEEADRVDEPISPYAFTKRAGELMNYTYHHLYGMDIVNLRFFTVYGERQRPDLAIHKFVRMIGRGETISIYGDGSSARDYTYYADTVKGVIGAIQYLAEQEGVYENINLGNNKPVKLIELVNTIIDICGKEATIQYINMQPGDVDITCAGIEKARSLLGYNPETPLHTGLTKFVDWYKKGS